MTACYVFRSGMECEKVNGALIDFTLNILLLKIALEEQWHNCHVDAKAAFLNGDIDW